MKLMLAAVATALLSLAAVPAFATDIDIDATSTTGTSALFIPAVYEIDFLKGAYQAFNYGPSVNPGYSDALFVSYGGNQYTYFLQGTGSGQQLFSDAASSLAAYQSAASFQEQVNGGAAFTVSGPITFNLSSAETVNFTVADSYYPDNSGGVSIDVSPVPSVSAAPEPATWALMLGGLGILGGLLRVVQARRREEEVPA